MIYQEFKPQAALADYIQMIWVMESETDEDLFPNEKILPDGIVEIVFHYTEPFYTTQIEGKKVKQPQGFAISQMKNHIELESDEKIGFVSVRCYPWGAHHFFDEPVKNFLDDTIHIKELWPDDYQSVLEKIKIKEPHQKVKVVEEYLAGKLQKHKKTTEEIDRAVKLIRYTKGQHSVEKISKISNINYKQLERGFLSTIGTTPKIFSRNSRFLHLCHHLKEYENKSMTELTYELGYYDQAHFIKDFKAFSGLTPKEYYEHNNIFFADF